MLSFLAASLKAITKHPPHIRPISGDIVSQIRIRIKSRWRHRGKVGNWRFLALDKRRSERNLYGCLRGHID